MPDVYDELYTHGIVSNNLASLNRLSYRKIIFLTFKHLLER